ncbi:MAG: MXAN_6521/LA_1396 family lipoprotein [Myxococcota bacterium]
MIGFCGRAVRVVAPILALSGCATVRRVELRPDYDAVDRTRTLRLIAVTAPPPAGDPKLGELWSLIARRYANHHRDFIVSRHAWGEAVPADACSGATQGVLRLTPTVARRKDGEAEVGVVARLSRCADGVTVWEAEAAGAWPERDESVAELTARYADELGGGIRPWVAASFHLLRHALDELPHPKLSADQDILEKVELGE